MRTNTATLIGAIGRCTIVKPDPPAPPTRTSVSRPKAWDSAGDFIDAFIDRLHDEAPGSSCYDEDTIRSILCEMLEEED